MNSERKIAVLRAGFVPDETVNELSRWGGFSIPDEMEIETNRRLALENIREATESRETVEVRMTDLDALKFYEEHQRLGRLYYSISAGEPGDPRRKRTTFVDVTYAKTPIGNYIIPWTDQDSDIFDLMLDEGTYLKPAGETRVHFANVDELYFGEQKAFMICTPTKPGTT
jgi:hypothetical protein